MVEDWQNGGFGLYFHWPFCSAKCPYCDFNSHVVATVDYAAWERRFIQEIQKLAALTKRRVVSSVFFGGGTPSLMPPELVGSILENVGLHWTLANDIEVTLEANPTSVEAGKFAGFKDAGINRVSMGVQALNDQDLKRLGRMHNTAEAFAAFDIARNTFDRVSFDLIYARQDQTLADWETELKTALSLSVDHLSLYQLTIEQGTAFGDRYNRGRLAGLPDDDLSADLFQLTQDLCSAAGLPAYEVSNHARKGQESRHNLIYWRYGDYGGIGPGAHGRLTIGGSKTATEHYSMPAKWLAASATAEKNREVLTDTDQAAEFLMMGLRLSEGVDLSRYTALSGAPLSPKNLCKMTDTGLLLHQGDRISVTKQGVMVLNSILAELLAD